MMADDGVLTEARKCIIHVVSSVCLYRWRLVPRSHRLSGGKWYCELANQFNPRVVGCHVEAEWGTEEEEGEVREREGQAVMDESQCEGGSRPTEISTQI